MKTVNPLTQSTVYSNNYFSVVKLVKYKIVGWLFYFVTKSAIYKCCESHDYNMSW